MTHDLPRSQWPRWARVAHTRLASKQSCRFRPRVRREPWAYFGSFGDDFFDELEAPTGAPDQAERKKSIEALADRTGRLVAPSAVTGFTDAALG